MYPKSTSFQVEPSWRNKEYTREMAHHGDMQHSNLVLHSPKNSMYQYFEIQMPYLILYEQISKEADRSTYMEFTESNMIQTGMPYSEFKAMGTLRLHSHDFYELTFVMSGELTMRIEDEYITYHRGECCLCNKNIHHMEITHENTEIVLFLMKEEYLRDVFSNNYYYDDDGNMYVVGSIFQQFFAENSKNSLYDAKAYADFRLLENTSPDPFIAIINQMIEEISGTHSGKSHLMKALFCRFIEMLENNEIYDSAIHFARLSNDEQLIYEIANAYQDKAGLFTRKEIEEITGYSSDHVERIMKRSTGMTLSEYGRRFLLKRAADLLTDSDLRIGEICEQLGYSNRYYFNQIFSKAYGMTPSAYRKAVRRV